MHTLPHFAHTQKTKPPYFTRIQYCVQYRQLKSGHVPIFTNDHYYHYYYYYYYSLVSLKTSFYLQLGLRRFGC